MTHMVDLDDLCGQCPNAGREICSECLRVALHDLLQEGIQDHFRYSNE